jgi:hypothetical protein
VTQHARVRRAFAVQSDWCTRLGSPFTARLCKILGRDLDQTTQTGHRVLNWRGNADAMGDGVPLRLAGALHGLVRQGCLPDLAAIYPPNPCPHDAELARALATAVRQADAHIVGWLSHAPQTNEVARSAVLYPGLRQIAAETGLPLALYELGASAGLNLYPDRLGYHIGGALYGPPDAPVILSPDWQGPPPAPATPVIQSRQGCDRSPLDISNTDHRARMLAFIWPDQPERLARMQAAMTLARSNPAPIAAQDAANWVQEQIPTEPEPGIARVLFHSIAYQYFPADSQNRITARMHQAGILATPKAPLAWLAFEQYGKDGPRLSLKLWPGGKTRVLAFADAHVRCVQWLG